MKRIIASMALVATTVMASAQTLNIATGSITTAVPAEQAGEMVYSNGGQTLTVCGKDFSVADIDRLYIDNSAVTDNTVNIAYNGTSASVVVAGNVARHLTVDVTGADVTIVQSESLADEITYTLAGTSANGSFNMDGKLKATVVLNGLTLTSTTGAPINIDNGKRINIVATDGTTNTFSDFASGTQKACFFVNGHAEFSGGGIINITGNAKHGYRSDEYTKLKKSFTGCLNILKATNDGIHVEQYLEMNNGTVTIANVGADGIDVAVTKDATDENNGRIFINGGSVTATTTAEDVKTLKSDSAIVITDGTLVLTATGNGSKAISSKASLTVTGGKVEALSLGGIYNEDLADESKPNAVKATGVITVGGGEFYAVASNKAFNTDVSTNGFLINGGKLMGISPKANAAAKGSQASKVYTKVQVKAGATVQYGSVAYTVPSSYSCNSAYVLVSPN